MSRHGFNQNRGAGNRHQHAGDRHASRGHGGDGASSHAAGSPLQVQPQQFVPPHFPFQPLPPPAGAPPCRVDLAQLGKLHRLHLQWPSAPMKLIDTLTLAQYDQDRFGFLRFEISDDQILGVYTSALFAETRTPAC